MLNVHSRLWIVPLLTVLTFGIATSAAAQPDIDLSIGVTWDASFRIGVEFSPREQIGFAGGIGFSVFSFRGAPIIVADALAIIHLRPGSTFFLDLVAGIPDARLIFDSPIGGVLALGGSLRAGYRFTERFSLLGRLGGGYPIFFEGKEIRTPMSFWPDFVLGTIFGL